MSVFFSSCLSLTDSSLPPSQMDIGAIWSRWMRNQEITHYVIAVNGRKVSVAHRCVIVSRNARRGSWRCTMLGCMNIITPVQVLDPWHRSPPPRWSLINKTISVSRSCEGVRRLFRKEADDIEEKNKRGWKREREREGEGEGEKYRGEKRGGTKLKCARVGYWGANDL